jgi:hypothetical protein
MPGGPAAERQNGKKLAGRFAPRVRAKELWRVATHEKAICLPNSPDAGAGVFTSICARVRPPGSPGLTWLERLVSTSACAALILEISCECVGFG